MLRCVLLAMMAIAGFVFPAARGSCAQVQTHVVQLNGNNFTLPIGFEIEIAASSALVPRPITADFD
ncbi:MAG TPA: hypothetical protein VGH32_06390 [Pirellulales bacterium]